MKKEWLKKKLGATKLSLILRMFNQPVAHIQQQQQQQQMYVLRSTPSNIYMIW